MLNKYRDQFVHFIISSPKKVLLIFGLMLALCTPGLLYVKANFTYKSWYSDKDPNVIDFLNFEKKFGNDDNAVIVIHDRAQTTLSKEFALMVKNLTAEIWQVEEILRVDSLNNFIYSEGVGEEIAIGPMIEDEQIEAGIFDQNEISRKISHEKILTDYLISHDFKTQLVIARVVPEVVKIPNHSKITNDIKKILENYKQKYPQYDFHLTGSVVVVDDFTVATLDDLAFLVPLLYLIFIVILYLKYRSVMAIVLVFSTISLSIWMMMGFCGYLGLEINTLTGAAPNILMTVAISDAIHIFSAFFESRFKGFKFLDGAKYSLVKNFYPTILTSVTTAVGFLSFYGALVEPVAHLGVMVGIGVIFAWLVTYFFLAPALVWGKKYFPEIEGVVEVKDKKDIVVSQNCISATNKIDQYKYLIVGITVLLFVWGAYYGSKLIVNMDPVEQFSKHHPSVISSKTISKEMGYSSNFEIRIDSKMAEGAKDPKFLNQVEGFNQWLLSHSEISKVVSLNYILKSLNQALNENNPDFYKIPETKEQVAESLMLYQMGLPEGRDINNLISLDNRYLRATVNWNITDSKTSNEYFAKINQEAKRRDLDILITGKNPLFHELTPYIVQTFNESFISAFIFITIILIISLRSFSLGLLTLIPNIFPLVLGAGLFYFSGYDVDMGTVLVASVCLGIAVDDSIHFLFEYKNYGDLGFDTRSAIEKIMATTYPALLMTTLLICLGFGSFILGNYVPNVKFGVSVAIILFIALIADFIILPAILLIHKNKK